MQNDFFHPFHCITCQVAHWPGTNLCQPYIGQWRGFRENNTTNHQSEKRRGNRGHWLCTGFNGAVFCHVACLAAVVAVGLGGFTALHSDVTNLTTPRGEIWGGHVWINIDDKKTSLVKLNWRQTNQWPHTVFPDITTCKFNSLVSKTLEQSLTCNISPCHKVFGCGQSHRRSSTSARWHDRSRGPCDRLFHRCSKAAPAPSWAPCSPWRCDHSCGSCSMLKWQSDGKYYNWQ